MKEIVVLSGKGGTGKTTLVGSFAALATSKVLVDCDVDAADLHLLLKPQVLEEREFWAGKLARIDSGKCTRCGLCQEKCRFDAIHDFRVDPLACEGCGLCSRICPAEAVSLDLRMSGRWYISGTPYGKLVHARLGPGQENSGKLVATVRQQARVMAHEQGLDLVLSDGPPGIGCPVISSLSGASLALLVTEPTPSGRHDLERVLGVCRHFSVPAAVCVNKYDLDEGNTHCTEEFCQGEGVPVLARIPFDDAVTRSIAEGVPLVEYSDGPASRKVQELWQGLSEMVQAPE